MDYKRLAFLDHSKRNGEKGDGRGWDMRVQEQEKIKIKDDKPETSVAKTEK